MCSAPDVPEPQRFQQAKAPVYRDRQNTPSTGRRGTILTGGSGIQNSIPIIKKTVLGQ